DRGHARQALADQADHRGRELAHERARLGVRQPFGRLEQVVDLGTTPFTCAPKVGEWRTSITRPSPTYMWTPHGRHGSKLRTVRMMSMPLKSAWSFSSNS